MVSSLHMDNDVTRQMQEMAQLIWRFTPNDGIHATAIPSLSLIRASEISQPIYSVHQPALCIVAQGSKLVVLGRELHLRPDTISSRISKLAYFRTGGSSYCRGALSMCAT